MNRPRDALAAVSPDVRLPPLGLRIADHLERDIIAGRYQEGERIREQEVADRFGASRGPVREAFRIVERDGFLIHEPWCGLRVVSFDAPALADLMDVVGALQGLIARLTATHANPVDLTDFSATIAEMERSVESGDAMSHQLHLAFEAGALLRAACGSDRAGAMMMQIGRLTYWQHRHLLDASLAWRQETVRLWQRLEREVSSGNPDGSDRAARTLVKHSRKYMLAQLLNRQPGPMLEELPAHMAQLPMQI